MKPPATAVSASASSPSQADAAASPGRADRLDALRGAALVWMAGFHFCFDLRHAGFLHGNFYTDPFWTNQRVAIVSLFLFCAGVGQALAVRQGQSWSRFWRRWGQIAACALAVSVASWIMFPTSYISFGVLHAMALMLLASRMLALGRVPVAALLVLGTLVVVLGATLSHPFFDSRLTYWLGFVTYRPPTEDFVPLFPWWGVMLWGLGAGQWLLARQPDWLWRPLPAAGRPLLRGLAVLGRWSLSFYMLHQLVLMGGVMAAARLLHP